MRKSTFLWENYIVIERLKYVRYGGIDAEQYFWRTTQQQEIDLVEDINGRITAYEFKLNPLAKSRIPRTFSENYPDSHARIIHPGNMEEITTAID